MNPFLLPFIAAILFLTHPALCWIDCGDGGICPDFNTCCVGTHGTSCISSKPGESGQCCDSSGSTGCGQGFTCADDDDKSGYCRKLNASDTSLPDRVPRYQLCSVPEEVLKIVHGFPVSASEVAVGPAELQHLAYLSTMGAVDSSQPEDLNRQAQIETFVIMVHGSRRNVDDYICCTSQAMPSDKYMLVAPWFLAFEDHIESVRTANGTEVSPLLWTEYGEIFHTWRYGADSINGAISSYAAVDAMVTHLVNDSVRYPRLRRIVVAGHSAGGQFTQRWALLTNLNMDTTNSAHRTIQIRTVVANPKSFCFLDARRFLDGSFEVPDESAIKDCLLYNQWEWGLGDEEEYLPTPYKDDAIWRAGGIESIIARYAQRDVVYLAGEEDILHNGNCMAKLQGRFRRERSEHFFASLKEVYGYPVHKRLLVEDVNHNHCLMFQSPAGHEAMFGN